MLEYKLYRMLKIYKDRFTKHEISTIKGQIKKGDYFGAEKGIKKVIRRYNNEFKRNVM